MCQGNHRRRAEGEKTPYSTGFRNGWFRLVETHASYGWARYNAADFSLLNLDQQPKWWCEGKERRAKKKYGR